MIDRCITDLCNYCVEHNAILPSLEAFEMGIEIPSVFVIFHEFIYRSSVGDSQWKSACLEAKYPAERFSPPQGEAFAMLLLKNNYFAWLWEAKLKQKELLVTDYDNDEDRSGKLNIGDAFLKMEINVELQDEDDLETSSFENLLVEEGDPLYQGLHKKTEAALKKVRRLAKKNDKYKEIKKQLDQGVGEELQRITQDDEREEGSGKEQEAMVEHRVKRRRMLKSFREYTNPKDNEGRFKGWSTRAADDMAELINKVRNEGTKEKRFRAAYRLTYHKKQSSSKKKKVLQETTNVNYETDIWGLDEDIADVIL